MSSTEQFTEPATDNGPLVDDAVEVGEDLDFQRAWWRFEKIAWIVLSLVLIGDAAGLFGRGWLAKAEVTSPDQTLHVGYERIERAGTPSEMTLRIGSTAVHDGRVRLFVSESLLQQLGAQRIIPQPATSDVGPNGVTYTFPATGSPAIVGIELEPSFPGVHRIELSVPGAQPIEARIAVLP